MNRQQGGIKVMWLTFALCAALAFGLRGILYHKTSTMRLNQNLLLCGVFASGAIINGVIALSMQSEWTNASLIGIQMGLFSFAASASMYKGFAVGKASIVAVLTALPAVVVVTMAYLLWGEKLHMMQLVAFVILVVGILTIRYSNELSLSNLQGAQWGLLAMLFFAGNDLSTKWSTMLHADPYHTLVFMFVTGSVCFGVLWLVNRSKEQKYSSQALLNYSNRKTFCIGLLVGITNAVGMILIIQAFSLGKTGLVSAVIALNVVLILLYTRFIVKEKFTTTQIIGIVLAFCGILLIHLFK